MLQPPLWLASRKRRALWKNEPRVPPTVSSPWLLARRSQSRTTLSRLIASSVSFGSEPTRCTGTPGGENTRCSPMLRWAHVIKSGESPTTASCNGGTREAHAAREEDEAEPCMWPFGEDLRPCDGHAVAGRLAGRLARRSRQRKTEDGASRNGHGTG